MLWYLWKVAGQISLKDWWDKYVIKDDSVLADYPIKVVRLLPQGVTSEEAILIFNNWWPTYFHSDGKVHLYYKLYDICLAYLTREEKMSAGLRIEIPIKLIGLYIWINDFPNFPKTILFNQSNTYTDWVKSNQTAKEFNKIINKITINITISIEPIIYHNGNDMFLIQNVRNGDLTRAMALSLYWKQTGINKGYEVEPIDTLYLVHKIYFLTSVKLPSII